MDFGSKQLYTFEVWHGTTLVADITTLCTNISYTITRNDVETLQFDVDLFEFENFCAGPMGGVNPSYLISPYTTDVKVRRNGVYLFGTQAVTLSFNLTSSDAGGGFNSGMDGGSSAATSDGTGMSQFPVTVTCTGYLNFFKDRYITAAYTSVERVQMALNMINTTQGLTNGSFGVTLASSQYSTGFNDTITYTKNSIKDEIQKLANMIDYPFDFAFDSNRVFSTYAEIGSVRSDISFVYGGDLSNVTAFAMDRDASQLYNQIDGYGYGIGSGAITDTEGDAVSQIDYYLREEIYTQSSVKQQSVLNAQTKTELAVHKDLLELPQITVVTPQLEGKWVNIGDIVKLQVLEHTWLSEINGQYRTEQIQVSLDDNQSETITYTFDNEGVS